MNTSQPAPTVAHTPTQEDVECARWVFERAHRHYMDTPIWGEEGAEARREMLEARRIYNQLSDQCRAVALAKREAL